MDKKVNLKKYRRQIKKVLNKFQKIEKLFQKRLNVIQTVAVTMLIIFILIFISARTEVYDDTLAMEESQYRYLSDIDYLKGESSVGWGTITMDKNLDSKFNSGLITLNVDGEPKKFLKGIAAHATSTVIFDISNYQYDFFSTYYGVDASRGTAGNGVKFAISTSVDGETWELHTLVSPPIKKGNSQAEFLNIPIRGKNYIKLYCIDLGNKDGDHCVYGNAKLYNEGYVEDEGPIEFIKSIDEYDQILSNTSLEEQLETNELLILQRKMIQNVGYDLFEALVRYDDKYKEALSYLMSNVDNLRMFTMGGEPDGSYINAMRVWCELYKKYKKDFEDSTITKYGNKRGDVYKKLAMSISLVYSSSVSLWVQTGTPENQSDAVKKYEIVKKMYSSGKYVVSSRQDHTPWFESLQIEEMRFVINSPIDDEEILWLYDYTQKQIDAHPNKEEEYLQPHHYMKYIWPNYTKPEYHDEANKEKYSSQYGNFLDYGVTFRPGLQKLWMVLDNGAVCGGISKIGSNIRSVHGTPSSVISQPGHAAIIYYRKNSSGQGYWTIDNDVSGWAQSGRTERLNLRMPNGFGNEEYIDFHKDWLGMATYVLLAQGALNDFSNYEASERTLLLADLYSDDIQKLLKIYRDAVTQEPLNIDGWYGLIKTYKKDSSKTEKDMFDLAKEIMEHLKFYPLPMYHLIREIESVLESPEYQFKFILERTKALTEAKNATNADTIQRQAVVQMASRLLGEVDTTLATFSFDGENKESIVLGKRFDDTGVRFDYSLDGKQNWKEVSFSADEPHILKLSKEEIASITSENDIYVHIVGVNYDEENLYKIDITDGVLNNSMLFGNDLENRVLGVNLTYEWRNSESDEWTSYAVSSPDNTGDKTLYVRIGATGTKLPSNSLTFTFTKDNQPDTRKYIPVSHLSIHAVSSEATSNHGSATYAIDANYNTRWHSAWNGSDTNRFITVKLDRPVMLSAVEFVPAGGGNGKIYDGTIWGSMDGENWEILSERKNLTYSNKADTVDQAIQNIKSFEIEEPKQVQYVKIVADRTNGNWFTARAFNFYQDITKDVHPVAGIGFSTTEPTNQNVVARLVNPSSAITITNNGGSDTYVFTENGDFTFEFVDEYGVKGSAKAKVDWIDRVAPTGKIVYSTTSKTREEVLATLTDLSEEVTIVNYDESNTDDADDNKNPNLDPFTFTFNENGSHIFEIQDKAGNVATIEAKVDWIDLVPPTVDVEFDVDTLTNRDVVAKLVNPNEEIKVLNNNGSTSYTFTENGEFVFEISDIAGNITRKEVVVGWIDKTSPTSSVEYSTKEKTKDPVVAKLVGYNEDIIVLNNNGSKEYTFTKNGKFTFEIQDMVGNRNSIEAIVDWIISDSGTDPSDPVIPDDPTDPSTPSDPTDPSIPSDPSLPETPGIQYKTYVHGNFSLKVNTDYVKRNLIFKTKKRTLPKEIRDKIKELKYDYFEIQLGDRTTIEDMILKFQYPSLNKLVLVYFVSEDNELQKIDFTDVSDNTVEMEIDELGNYLFVYQDKTILDDSEEMNDRVRIDYTLLVVIIILLIIMNIILIFVRKKKVKNV